MTLRTLRPFRRLMPRQLLSARGRVSKAAFEAVEQRRLLAADPALLPVMDESGEYNHGWFCGCGVCGGSQTTQPLGDTSAFDALPRALDFGGIGLELGATVADGFDPDGEPGVAEGGARDSAALAPIAASSTPGQLIDSNTFPTSAPLSETFQLNSRPGALQTIYLDFDGHVTQGTTWNSQFGSTITTPAFSFDFDRSNFSNAERQAIQEVWLRVAEDFAPFDVNVTTQDPGIDALSRQGDNDFGIRVAIGPNNWFFAAGGVAQIGSFRWSSDTPTFVFTDGVGNTAKGIAEASSHEVGHTLGLFHDGNTRGSSDASREYYFGHGSGTTGWAPILGIGYDRNVTQWSDGQYTGGNQFQNDLAIIASSANGFGFKADFHSGAIGSAATLLPQDGAGDTTVVSTISTRTDQDAFRFSHGGGDLDIQLDTLPSITNLDAELTLWIDNQDGTYTLVAEDNPVSSLEAGISGTYLAGDYIVRVDGVGVGDPLANFPNGYSDYGSLGQYTLDVNAAPFDSSAPEAFDVFASGSTWTSSFLDDVDPEEGLGIRVVESGAATGLTSPFTGVDTITVRFSEQVLVDADDLTATLGGVPMGFDTTAFSYDGSTGIATWRLDAPLDLGRAELSFSGSGISDFAGNGLTGLTDFDVRVLPGDADQNGAVGLADFGLLRAAFGQTVVDANYSVFADFDRDGFISLADFGVLRSNFGQTV